MHIAFRLIALASAALSSLGASGGIRAQQAGMTFFVTSVGSGKGADLGGLAGADAHCQRLATAVGAGRPMSGRRAAVGLLQKTPLVPLHSDFDSLRFSPEPSGT